MDIYVFDFILKSLFKFLENVSLFQHVAGGPIVFLNSKYLIYSER